MNEETILESRISNNGQNESKKESGAWKNVTLGGVTGILMGAGMMYAGQAVAATKDQKTADDDVQVADPNTTEAQASESDVQIAEPDVQVSQTGVKIASSHDDLSFGQAFAAARAEVGPGGAFYWHGGIYNTYTAEEWNAMSDAQKNDFAHHVQPEIHPSAVSTPTDTNTYVIVEHHHHVHHHVETTPTSTSSNTAVNDDSDVHIVGRGEIEGHEAIAVDLDNDYEADVYIVDMPGEGEGYLTPDDVVIDVATGNMATLGQLSNEPDPNQLTAMENPDVAPDMPDYMNDALLDA